MNDPRHAFRPERQPVFNMPTVVVALLALLAGIHFIRTQILDPDVDFTLVLTFAFIPARVTQPVIVGSMLPGGEGAAAWSFVSYALLHADWAHLVFNGLWLAAFGSPLAWRFGAVRFLVFSAIGAAAGALLHLAIYSDSMTPLVGASAAISAYMAAAARFVFAAGGPLRGLQGMGAEMYRRPAPPLSTTIRDSRVVIFLAVWFGLNLVVGLFGGGSGMVSGTVAWEAHIGGFLAGLALFSLFDPVGRVRP